MPNARPAPVKDAGLVAAESFRVEHAVTFAVARFGIPVFQSAFYCCRAEVPGNDGIACT